MTTGTNVTKTISSAFRIARRLITTIGINGCCDVGWTSTSLKMCVQAGGDGGFWLNSDNLINEPAILKNQQSRNTSNTELSGSARILVDVQLRDSVPSSGFNG